jgi:hypothetical protein
VSGRRVIFICLDTQLVRRKPTIYILMIKKQAYIAPNTKIRTAELEAIICQSVAGSSFLHNQATVEDDSEDNDWGW